MPYVITTITPRTASDVPPHLRSLPQTWGAITSRLAVTTLDEARADVFRRFFDGEHSAAFSDPSRATGYKAQFNALDTSGGTVGPLPDGTVIGVTLAEWSEIRAGAGRRPFVQPPDPEAVRHVIDAYNAAQGHGDA